jgi:colanic acid/amylovoran biosynthesis glycosyltransferase
MIYTGVFCNLRLILMNDRGIAIVTVNPDTLAETYIRQHIRTIVPGNTVVVYFEGDGNSLEGVPSFKVRRDSQINPWVKVLRSLYSYLIHGYPGAITSPSLDDFLRRHNVGAVFAEFGPTGCAVLPTCKRNDLRLVVNFHGHDATVMPRRRLIRRAYKYLDRYADGYVCGSRHFSNVLRKIGLTAEKINVVPCGIELDQFDAEREKDPNLIVAVGRFTQKKAPHITIQSFSGLASRHPAVRLEMVGDGQLLPQCKNLIRDLGLGGRVILHGAKPHDFVKELLRRASIFVQHSVTAENGDTESQGVSLLEAMASGVPVVTTNHNGFAETVIDGETGFLVPEHDVSAMCDAMLRLQDDVDMKKRMGRSARQRVVHNFESTLLAAKLRDIVLPA